MIFNKGFRHCIVIKRFDICVEMRSGRLMSSRSLISQENWIRCNMNVTIITEEVKCTINETYRLQSAVQRTL